MCYHSSIENNKAHEISGTYHTDRTFKIKIKEDNKMDYLKLQKVGKLQMDLIEKIQNGKLELQAIELQATSVEDTTKR